MKYHGGPFDGREFDTRYDHLPVIRLPHSIGPGERPRTIEHYELRTGERHHIATERYGIDADGGRGQN